MPVPFSPRRANEIPQDNADSNTDGQHTVLEEPQAAPTEAEIAVNVEEELAAQRAIDRRECLPYRSDEPYDDLFGSVIDSNGEVNLDILDPRPIVPGPAKPGEVDWSQFTQQQLIEFEHLFARVYGMRDKRVPFANSSAIKIRILPPEVADASPGESGNSDGGRRPPNGN